MVDFLESSIVNLTFLGKIAPNVDFSGKGKNAFSLVPFQIYFRIHLCWYLMANGTVVRVTKTPKTQQKSGVKTKVFALAKLSLGSEEIEKVAT
ncbi:hypothetical protein BCT97_015725 [Vibrio breoganii]|uniref:hypothetical protein n=1 Tax=Vibrio breoganii TaxID=553239 RepID=UPI000CA918F1|nr:hypothetical protein [Vibrio breoganii]PMK55001.1 hypothetical protein BCT97_00465 [Vibrio breoganii]PMO29308.1 hypothetical protein BCT14_06255 [Vibrio breoganii]PMO31596.1 hypothetical protein BCT13_11265 [Vibrio breoganii]